MISPGSRGNCMDIQRLRYFKVVAQMEHMSRAAEKLHLTQPALSKAISLLEEEVGSPLFARVGRAIELNENGKAFYRYAERALSALDDGVRFVREMNDPHHERIKFQTNVVTMPYLMSLITGFRKANPRTRFEVITQYSKTRFMLDCDCYVTAVRIPLYQCTSVPIFAEEIMLGVPRNHPLAKRKSIKLREAEGETFIGVTETQSWAEEVAAFCIEAGFKPDVAYICDSIYLIADLVGAGEGVAFMPAQSQGPYPDSVALLHIEEPRCFREFNLSWQTKKRLSPQAVLFIEHAKAHFASLMEEKSR